MHALLRYTLDLFSEVPEVPEVQDKPLKVPDKTVFKEAVPLASAIDDVTFSHPQANRVIRFGGAQVAYAFSRARRKSIGMVVGPDGLVVRAPRWVLLPDVEAALFAKSDWILRKLRESRERQQRLESARIVWADGAEVPFLGGVIQLQLDAALQCDGSAALQQNENGVDVLVLRLNSSSTAQQIRDAAQSWLMRQALENFRERVEFFANRLSVTWKTIKLSSAGTRWGSASADGSIRLNWRLIHFSQAVIDYVVAHEVCHLRVMDHSPRFWDTVASVVPDYAKLRLQLKEDAIPRW